MFSNAMPASTAVRGALWATCSALLHHVNFLFVSLAGSLYTSSHAVTGVGVRGATAARLFVGTLWSMYAFGLCAALCSDSPADRP